MDSSTRKLLMILGISCLIFTVPCISLILFGFTTAPETFGASFTFVSLTALSLLSIPAILAIQKAYKAPEISSQNIPPKTVERPRTTSFEIDEKTEGKILQMAKRHNGRLTATHLAMDSPLTIEQSTQILSDFERRGIVYSTVTAHGGTEYVFPDLLKNTERDSDLDEFDNQILYFERSKQAAKEHAEHFTSTHKN